MYKEILRMINDIENVDLIDNDTEEKEEILTTLYNNLIDMIRGTTSISLKDKIELIKLVQEKKNSVLNHEVDYDKNNSTPKIMDYEEEKTKNIAFIAAKMRCDEQNFLKRFINRLLNKESFKVYERNYRFLSIDQINSLYIKKR